MDRNKNETNIEQTSVTGSTRAEIMKEEEEDQHHEEDRVGAVPKLGITTKSRSLLCREPPSGGDARDVMTNHNDSKLISVKRRPAVDNVTAETNNRMKGPNAVANREALSSMTSYCQ